MIRLRYALEILFRGLELSEDLLLIGHFICGKNNLKNKSRIKHRLESCAKVPLLNYTVFVE
ncbi:hypothetical protein T4B_7797 [Trichinella pseudospiralis]|uniref:Uncharacterized protein n=2 Tax=Trichinella pseudospiralis TaxID=6337 RepID=A0A0V1FJN0_TRIPS|nr:hypothetical protein T4A_3495 [Trichinella pseudospiralis]KRY70102.1 hypothetical protein T4A_3208 [Trichinella pseudospiralis]KRY85491.1 hypothetical protein T4D_5698 [Trichinella pseudospiralis]KRY90411.1 hypothetical protein T4D_11557 [Trichinella pseudospiralis]KRZ30085.1 hypothetical protein T4B_7797 [Trichinella pseudospiralis]